MYNLSRNVLNVRSGRSIVQLTGGEHMYNLKNYEMETVLGKKCTQCQIRSAIVHFTGGEPFVVPYSGRCLM